jgi:uncharacterized OB-fold protein
MEGRLYVPYHNWYGTVASRFFQEIRDHARLLGTRCPACAKVFMPPRSVCPGCLGRLEEWVELPPTGTLLTYTQVNQTYSTYYQPREAPYLVGIVQLDGAHTGLCHLLGDVEPGDAEIDMRVEAVFREERKGNILDIAHFRPIQ